MKGLSPQPSPQAAGRTPNGSSILKWKRQVGGRGSAFLQLNGMRAVLRAIDLDRWLCCSEYVLVSGMTEPSKDQVEQLTQAFGRFTRRFKVAEAVAAADNALNALDAQTLVFIGDNPGCGMSDVARHLNVALTTMSSAVDRLVRKDLVERRRPDDDRRSVALTATAKGRQVVEDQIAGYREACRAMLRALDRREQAELIRLTEKIAGSEA